jgi:hypothetical protein
MLAHSSKASVALVVALLAVAACARQAEGPSTTSVTSGSTSGVRVTDVRTDQDAMALRLADEVCAREVACNHIGVDARYVSEEACLADQGARAPTQSARWSCQPTQSQTSVDECLAAIRNERCETTLTHIDYLVACRSAAICGR